MASKKESPAKPKREPELAAASFVINAETGAVLLGKDADMARDPASLTKLMTAYTVLRAVKKGDIKLDDKIKISAGAAALDNNTLNIPVTKPDGSKDTLSTLPEGTQMTVREALVVMMTSSANGVAKALGEALAPMKLNSKGKPVKGSERDFAREMTRIAKDELEMTSSSFINASGLNNGGADQKTNLSTARDLGKLAQALMRDFPEYEKLMGAPAATTRLVMPDGQKLVVHSPTTNHFVRDFAAGSKRAGKEGFAAVGPQKTGYNQLSGGINLLSTAQNADGVRLVSVVLGGTGSDNRYAANLKNLRSGFAKLDESPQFAAVYKGGAERAELVAAVSPTSAFGEAAKRNRQGATAGTLYAQARAAALQTRFNSETRPRPARLRPATEGATLTPVSYHYSEPAPAATVPAAEGISLGPIEDSRAALAPVPDVTEVPAAVTRSIKSAIFKPEEP